MAPRASLLLLMLLWPGPGWGAGDPAEEGYQEARSGYYELKGNEKRRRLRHHWLQLAQKFEQVASRHPRSPRAPDALYTAGELYAELSRISGNPEDVQAAAAAYRRLLKAHPSHRLSDDGALALARIHAHRTGDPEAARRVLLLALAGQPKGDQVPELRALLKALPASPRPSPDSRQSSPPARLALPTLREIQEKLREVRVGKSEKVSQQDAAERLRQAEPALRAGEEVTLAEQLGLKLRRVVIDAGHGGHDTGAIGPSGKLEKDVTLAISQRLGQRLLSAGLEVVLTRERDRFLSLEERADLANQERGDLFISLHCNSAPSRNLRGVETYSLNIAADRYSVRLAARENASSEKGMNELQYILADLATKANTDESSRLAEQVQKGLVSALAQRHPGVKDLGHKQALFFVLLGARMPSILVETSFLSNPEEEKLLASEGYQAEVAEAIAQAVLEFFRERVQLAKAE